MELNNGVENIQQKEKLPVPEFIYDIRDRKYNTDAAIAAILNYSKITNLPINVWQIARDLNFEVLEANFVQKETSGLMFDMDSPIQINEDLSPKRAIILNRDSSKEEQAFTIAHEIAHFVLHCNEKGNFYEAYHITRDKNKMKQLTEEQLQKKQKEDEADAFAAVLLMPSQLFKTQYENFIASRSFQETIKDLMTIFMVEKEAVYKRFKELKIVVPIE